MGIPAYEKIKNGSECRHGRSRPRELIPRFGSSVIGGMLRSGMNRCIILISEGNPHSSIRNPLQQHPWPLWNPFARLDSICLSPVPFITRKPSRMRHRDHSPNIRHRDGDSAILEFVSEKSTALEYRPRTCPHIRSEHASTSVALVRGSRAIAPPACLHLANEHALDGGFADPCDQRRVLGHGDERRGIDP